MGISAYEIGDGYLTDIQYYDNNNYYNTVRAGANAVGGAVGGWAGFCTWGWLGAQLGFGVGAPAAGVGAIPCSIIGGLVFGTIGAIGGSELGTSIVDMIYER